MFRALIERIRELSGAPLEPEEMGPATRELLRAPVTPETAREATEGLKQFALRVLGSWHPGSILLTPTLALLPRPVGSVGPELGIRFSTFLRAFNVTGKPALPHARRRPGRGPARRPGGLGGAAAALARQLEPAAPWPLTAAPRAG